MDKKRAKTQYISHQSFPRASPPGQCSWKNKPSSQADTKGPFIVLRQRKEKQNEGVNMTPFMGNVKDAGKASFRPGIWEELASRLILIQGLSGSWPMTEMSIPGRCLMHGQFWVMGLREISSRQAEGTKVCFNGKCNLITHVQRVTCWRNEAYPCLD